MLSELLVELYQGARTRSLDDFQGWVLGQIKRQLPHDHGAWGTTADPNPYSLSRPHFGLDDAGISLLPFQQEGQRGQLLAGSHRASGMPTLYLNLFRAGAANFDGEEQKLVNLLLPHLAEALAINRRLRLTELKHSGESVALCDNRGQIQLATPEFESLARQEWPSFDIRLPPAAMGREAGSEPFTGKTLQLRVEPLGHELLVWARATTPIEHLTRREQAIAEHFTRGLSYKAVANKLGISPATVRNHLSRIYGKLGVHDKGELATLYHQLHQPRHPQPRSHCAY